MRKKNIAIEIICLLFVLLFIYAAVSKLIDYQKFKIQIGQSPMLTSLSGFIAWFIPTIEVAIALLLVILRTRLIGLIAAFSLMAMFTTYIVAITQFSEYVPCSCGGVLQNLGWAEHFIFNLTFVALSIAGVVLQVRTNVKPEDAPRARTFAPS